MPGILYLVPNTLGTTELPADTDALHPLESIIPRQVQAIAARLDYFVAENAKTTRAFLKLLGSSTALARPIQEIQISELNVNTPAAALPALLAPLLEGRDGGLISEAGVPAVADPGANLVRLAHQHGIQVRPLVGPSSLLLAVMASGLNGQSFAFHGYLPTDAADRAKRLRELEQRSRKEKQTQIFIETPYRNKAMLDALLQTCDASTLLCVAVDVTQDDEQIVTHRIKGWPQARIDLHKRPAIFLFLGQ